MWSLIKFEFSKLLHSKKNIIVLALLLAVFMGLSIFFCIKSSQYTADWVISNYQTGLESDGIEPNPRDVKNPYTMLNTCRREGKLTDEFLNWNISYCQDIVDKTKEGPECPRYVKYRNQLAVDKYRLQNNGDLFEPQGSMNGLCSMIRITELYSFIFVLVFALIAGDIFNKEYKGGAIKLLATQPFSRTKIIGAKYLAVSLFLICAFTAIVLINSLVTGLIFGFPPLDFPSLMLEDIFAFKTNIVFLGTYPLWQLILVSYAMDIALIFAVSSIALFLSLIIKNDGFSISIISLFAFLSCVAYYSLYVLAPSHFNIFTYANSQELLDSMFTAHGWGYRPPLTFTGGIVCALVYIALFYSASVIIVKRKELKA